MTLTNDQRGQLRKDIIDLRDAVQHAIKSPFVPQSVADLAQLQLRVIDTLAIHAGAYEKTEEPQHG